MAPKIKAKEPEVVEPEEKKRDALALVGQHLPTEININQVKDKFVAIRAFQKLVQMELHEGSDYGVIPGTKKPTLLKPGAEKIVKLLDLADTFEIIEKVEDWDKGFFFYNFKVILVSLITGQVVSEGVGSCNSKESKYRWFWVPKDKLPAGVSPESCESKGTKRTLFEFEFAVNKGETTGHYGKPAEYWEKWRKAIREGRAKAGEKETRDKKKMLKGYELVVDETLYRIPNDDPYSIVNCVTPETRILTRDLRWVPAGEIKSGTKLIAVEDAPSSKYKRSFAESEAILYGRKTDIVYQIDLEDGRRVCCNGEHKWLVKKIGMKGTEWTSTESIYNEIQEHRGRPRRWLIMSLGQPWEEEGSKSAGYLAGLYDADGCLGVCVNKKGYQQVELTFAQQNNCVLDYMKAALKDLHYSFGIVSARSAKLIQNSESKKPVYDLRIHGGLTEIMRFLGTIRPPRLINKWLQTFKLNDRRFEGRGLGNGKGAPIASIECIGPKEIVLLGSSAGTYIAEGLVAHNTIEKMAKKRAMVDAALSVGRLSELFTQDLEDLDADQKQGAEDASRDHDEAPGPQEKPKAEPKPKAPAPSPAPAAGGQGMVYDKERGKVVPKDKPKPPPPAEEPPPEEEEPAGDEGENEESPFAEPAKTDGKKETVKALQDHLKIAFGKAYDALYKSFKDWLGTEAGPKLGHNFVGLEHGNWSLNEGDIEGLLFLYENRARAVEGFVRFMDKAKKAQGKGE